VVSYGGKPIPRWRTAAILIIVISPYLSEKVIRFRWNFVHSSKFWTERTSRDQKWNSCIGQTPSSTQLISCPEDFSSSNTTFLIIRILYSNLLLYVKTIQLQYLLKSHLIVFSSSMVCMNIVHQFSISCLRNGGNRMTSRCFFRPRRCISTVHQCKSFFTDGLYLNTKQHTTEQWALLLESIQKPNCHDDSFHWVLIAPTHRGIAQNNN